MNWSDATAILIEHGYKEVMHGTWWKADKDPYIAVLRFDDMKCSTSVDLIHVFGPSDMVPAFRTGTLSTEWALDRQLTDLETIRNK